MQADLKRLEDKIFSLVMLCKQLQHDNSALQEEVGALSKKNQALEQKLEGARLRIEGILAHLPGEENAG